jgi:hypothetical protein
MNVELVGKQGAFGYLVIVVQTPTCSIFLRKEQDQSTS